MNLIGIAGKKESGKDEIYKIIAMRLPNVHRIAFADALKQEVARMYLVPVEFIDSHKKNFRLILQGHGTDYRRQMHGEDYWIRQFQYKLHDVSKMGDDITVVVPDVRFVNEARMIHELGGVMFKVERHSDTSDEHMSENDLNQFTEFDRHINNNGSLKQLEVEVTVALDMCHLLPTNKP